MLSSAQVAVLAVGVWLLTVLGCAVLERRGQRGPAEWLLRRLSYGRTADPRQEGRRDPSARTQLGA